MLSGTRGGGAPRGCCHNLEAQVSSPIGACSPPHTTVLLQVDCVEAIFNLGLVNIHLGLASDALQAFEKLHTIVPNNTEVLYHIANLYEVR